MRALFFSDLHLKENWEPKSQLFAKVLREHGMRASHVFLLGDIFDLWIGPSSYFQFRYHDVVMAIQDLVNAGVEVHIFEGNHDIHLARFWNDVLGIHVHERIEHFRIGDFIVRCEHGDLMNPDDTGYLALRWALRTPLIRHLSGIVPGPWIGAFGDRWSAMSRKSQSRKSHAHSEERRGANTDNVPFEERREDRIRKMMHRYALKEAEKDPFDLLITGHTHVQDLLTFDLAGRPRHFVNLGSWFKTPSYFYIEDSKFGFEEIK